MWRSRTAAGWAVSRREVQIEPPQKLEDRSPALPGGIRKGCWEERALESDLEEPRTSCVGKDISGDKDPVW